MTDDLERRLTVQLRERVPEPPKLCTAQDVWDRGPSSRGRRTIVVRAIALVGTAAVVLAVALSTSLWRRTPATQLGDRPTPTSTRRSTAPVVTTDPRALVGPTWTLHTFRRGDGEPVSVAPARAATIKIDRDGGITNQDCSYATSRLDHGRIVFHQPFINALITSSCGPRTSIAQSNLVAHVLSRTVTWSITGDTLTVDHPGIGVLAFVGIQANATVTGEVFVVGGPQAVRPEGPKPVVGARILLNETAGSYPVHARTGTDGHFTASVTPGRWEVTVTERNLHGVQCSAGAPVNATAHRTAHVRVYCSLR